MPRKLSLTILLVILLLTACGDKPYGHYEDDKMIAIVEEQAIKTVKSQHEKTVTHIQSEYIVKWERKSNCDSGIDYVSDKSGKVTHGEHTIC